MIISVHLPPGKKDSTLRREELEEIASWVHSNDEKEHDFIIMGDMNIENSEELKKASPNGYWDDPAPYPGEPYEHNLFKQYYSDHNPVVFRLLVGSDDD